MASIDASVTIDVTVHDPAQLWSTAHGVYDNQNGAAADDDAFQQMCGTEHDPDIGACLQMIFDPGISPDGCQIEGSNSEVHHA